MTFTKDQILIQEQQFTFENFTYDDALQVALNIINDAKKIYSKPVRVRITIDGDLVVQIIMDGKTGSEWLDRKERTVKDFGHSSLYTSLALTEKELEAATNAGCYALCGGGMPFTVSGKKGIICVSGLDHIDDHMLLINNLHRTTTI